MSEEKKNTMQTAAEKNNAPLYNATQAQMVNDGQNVLDGTDIFETTANATENYVGVDYTVKDFIVSKYNTCSLLSYYPKTDRQVFFPILDALNSVFLSNLYTDDKVSISVFDKLRTLNFRAHNYEDALHYISKAFQKENNNTNREYYISCSIDELEQMFSRRWQAALCSEYIGLSVLHRQRGQEAATPKLLKPLVRAIRFLIGDRIFKKIEHLKAEEFLRETLALHNNENLYDLSDLFDESETISCGEIGWNGPCLAAQIHTWFSDEYIQKTEFEDENAKQTHEQRVTFRNRCIEDVSHALAHCLSEYVKYRSGGNPHTQEDRYLLKISDCIMKHLGNKYITCHATLLIERREYFAALNLLEQAKRPVIEELARPIDDISKENYAKSDHTVNRATSHEETIETSVSSPTAENTESNDADTIDPSSEGNEWTSIIDTSPDQLPEKLFCYYDRLPNNLQKKLNEIALIEFYRWYYAVFSSKVDAESSKNMFEAYCKYSGDSVASTYYNVIYLKGLLIKGFGDIDKGVTGSDLVDLHEEIRSAHDGLEKSKPGPTIHTDIWEEWKLLDIAYKAFCLFAESEKDTVLFCHRLFNLLVLDGGFSDNAEIINNIPSTNPKQEPEYYSVKTKMGAFIYRGTPEYLQDMLQSYDTAIDCVPFSKSKSGDFILPEDISNVYLAMREDKIEEDIDFLKSITKSDRAKVNDRTAAHSIYIDSSLITNTEKVNCAFQNSGLGTLEEFVDENVRVAVLEDRSRAVQFCITFSCLEMLLARLYTPLDSNLISPITEDETYSSQVERVFPKVDAVNQTGNRPELDASVKYLLQEDEVIGVTPIPEVQQVDDVVSSCLTTAKDAINEGIKIDIGYLKKHTDITRISYIVRCEFNNSKSGSRIALVNAFDIKSSQYSMDTFLCSDTIVIQEPTQFEEALGHFSSELYAGKLRGNRFHTYKRQCWEHCITRATVQKSSNNQYKILRSCLYSTTGILLPDTALLLIYKNDNEEYTLFVLEDDHNGKTVFETSTCQMLREYNSYRSTIEDVVKLKSQVEKEPTLYELINQISPKDENQNYIFVSYRANNKDESLCLPVYRDIIALQRILKELTNGDVGVYFDVREVSENIPEELEAAIKSPKCIGAIVYVTAEYLLPYADNGMSLKPDQTDYCFSELEWIKNEYIKREEKGQKFLILPVFFKTARFHQLACKSIQDIVSISLHTYRSDENWHGRVKPVHFLFACDITDVINRPCLEMQYNGSHFLKDEYLKNALRKAGFG